MNKDNRWIVGITTRTDAGGKLYIPVRYANGKRYEHDATPTHSETICRGMCVQLNRMLADGVVITTSMAMLDDGSEVYDVSVMCHGDDAIEFHAVSKYDAGQLAAKLESAIKEHTVNNTRIIDCTL
jgi:hypothetical protein